MFTYRANGARLCAALLILLFCSTAFAGSTKVEVCHIPPDNPDSYHTIKINENALASHLAHFDVVGPCNSVCAQLCDDGNACTVDYEGDDCEQNGCSVVSEPVSCDDSNECTDDLCDPVSGCFNPVAVTCEPVDLCMSSTCDPIEGVCEETPKSCDPGESCNSLTGECETVDEPPIELCPCFDSLSLQALGAPMTDQCGNTEIAFVEFSNGNYACSGYECVNYFETGCYIINSGNGQYENPITTEEDAACRALIANICQE